MRVDFKEINSTWINAIRLYDMVNKGKKAFSRDGSRYELSKDLFEYLKRFQLYFE
jgi:hypothetical protein